MPPENTRVYKNYRCSRCGLATSGYLVRPSADPADNTCMDCGGSAFIVRLTMPLPADTIIIPLEESRGHWRTSMRRVTLSSAVRAARGARRTTATRRLERQRRGEVPPLVQGYVDVTFNYYTAYSTSSSSIRRLSSGTIKHSLK